MSDEDSSLMSVTESNVLETLGGDIHVDIGAENKNGLEDENINNTVSSEMQGSKEANDKLADEIAEELADEIHLTAQSDSTSNSDDTEGLETEASITNVTELSNAEESNSPETENLKKTKNVYSGLPQFGGKVDWYKHKCFKRYWDHYNYVMTWCQKHCRTLNQLKAKQYANLNTQRNQRNIHPYQLWHYGIPPAHPYWSSYLWQQGQGQGQTNSVISRKARRRGSRKQKRGEKDSLLKESEDKSEEHTQVSGSDAFEMEITEDMIEFFSKSEEHRKQRDEEKKENKERQKKEPELINLEDVQASPQRERTIEAPKERPGSRRTAEMRQLYGKGAAMIHGMETALQMTFDRNKDLKQPKLWPNMPLKIVFN